MTLTKHNVWEMSRTISAFLGGDMSQKEAAYAADKRLGTITDEEVEALKDYPNELREQIAALQHHLAGTVNTILLTEELPESLSVWTSRELLKYLAACQKYEDYELLVSAVLAQPNPSLMFDKFEPVDGD